MNNPLFISPERELSYSLNLIDTIKRDKWIDNNTILINCSPEYTSRLTHIINHKLSYINNNSLFEQINLELPEVGMSQVWDSSEREFRFFDRYLSEWKRKYVNNSTKYLFIINSIFSGKKMNKIKLLIGNSCDYKFASIFLNKGSILTPDYYHRRFDESEEGKLIFFWENTNNKKSQQ